jgi:putative restriction endonuclease
MGHPGESRLLDKAEVSATNMKSAIEVLNVFENIRRAQRAGVYAPHKPLLLLLALARVQRGEPRLVEFTAIDALLKQLLAEFGPTSAAKSRHYPFWHLATDGHGALWDLSGPREVLKRPAGATPSLGELREHHIKAGFPADVDEALRHIPGLLQAVASRLLDTYFPATLHSDIVATLGLDLDGANEMRDDVPVAADYSAADRRRRDPGFRERVLRAYEYRCCVCGFDLRIGHTPAGLEAAHIQWHHVGGPDIEPNGLSLCALHHKLFDLEAHSPSSRPSTESSSVNTQSPVAAAWGANCSSMGALSMRHRMPICCPRPSFWPGIRRTFSRRHRERSCWSPLHATLTQNTEPAHSI